MKLQKAVLVAALVPLMIFNTACNSQSFTNYAPVGLAAFNSLIAILSAAGALSPTASADATKIIADFKALETNVANGQSILTALQAELPQFLADVGAASNSTWGIAVTAGVSLIITTLAAIQANSKPAVSDMDFTPAAYVPIVGAGNGMGMGQTTMPAKKQPVPSAHDFAVQFNQIMVTSGHPELQIKVPPSTMKKVLTVGIAH